MRNLGEEESEKTDKVDPPADDEEGPGIKLNRPEIETPVGGQRIPPQNPTRCTRTESRHCGGLGHNAERLSATRGVAASIPRALQGGVQSNINPFASVSCTQRQSSRQSSTTAPSPQYTLFGGGQTGGRSQLAPTPPQQVEDRMAALQAAAASGDLQTARWIVKYIEQEAVHNDKEKK